MAELNPIESELDHALDDPQAWDQPRRAAKSEKRQRSAVVSVRMSEAELATVQHRAHAAGQTLGAYMRDLALRGGAPGLAHDLRTIRVLRGPSNEAPAPVDHERHTFDIVRRPDGLMVC